MAQDEQHFLSWTHAYRPLIIMSYCGDFLVGSGYPVDRRFFSRLSREQLLDYLYNLKPSVAEPRTRPVAEIDELEIEL